MVTGMAPPQARLADTAQAIAPAVPLILPAAALALLASAVVPPGAARIMLLSGGATLLALAVLLGLLHLRNRRAARILRTRLDAVVGHDPEPCLATDGTGRIRYLNPAAAARFGRRLLGCPISDALRDVAASPVTAAQRLQTLARRGDGISHTIATRDGTARLRTHRLLPDGVFWRLESAPGGTTQDAPDIPGVPDLVCGRDHAILSMNSELQSLVHAQPPTVEALFAHWPVQPDAIGELLTDDGPRRVRVERARHGSVETLFLFPAAERDPASSTPTEATEFEALPVALVRLTDSGEVAQANAEARRLLSIDTLPVRFSELVDGLGRPVADWLRDAQAGRGHDRPEILRASRVEPERFVQISLRRLDEGEHKPVMAVINDATDFKSLEAKFVQSQKMQAIGQLAGGVAHDFNNLLTAISGHCDLLLLRRGEDDPDYPDLVQIHHNTNRAASLVGQLLAFSRKQSHKPELLDLHDTLSDLTHLLNRLVGERVTLTPAPAPDLPHLRADKRQFEQVMMNLVVNARDAMPDGGEVTINAQAQRLDTPLQRGRAQIPPGDYVVITVTDEGVGIAPERLERVFEPFYSTKRTGEGTGLGLSTVYGIMKQSGGYVFVDSVQGEGTRFTLYFPAHDAPEGTVAPTMRANEAARHGDGVVLLVEDEAPVRAFAGRALRARGYSVLEVDSAEAALELIEDDDLHVDIFVTDITLPGVDGPGWVTQALRTRPGIPTVFISGYAADTLDETQEKIPDSIFLPKPFSLNELANAVRNQLSRRVETAT